MTLHQQCRRDGWKPVQITGTRISGRNLSMLHTLLHFSILSLWPSQSRLEIKSQSFRLSVNIFSGSTLPGRPPHFFFSLGPEPGLASGPTASTSVFLCHCHPMLMFIHVPATLCNASSWQNVHINRHEGIKPKCLQGGSIPLPLCPPLMPHGAYGSEPGLSPREARD
jgi:hypothetical protein